MVGGCEYDRLFMCGKTDGSHRIPPPRRIATFFQFAFRYYGNTPGRRRPRAHLASMPPAITLAPVQPTYGDGRVGAALSHIAKRRSLRCPDQGRLGDRSVSAIQHCTHYDGVVRGHSESAIIAIYGVVPMNFALIDPSQPGVRRV